MHMPFIKQKIIHLRCHTYSFITSEFYLTKQEGCINFIKSMLYGVIMYFTNYYKHRPENFFQTLL